jgi:hypothetical protein
MKFALAVALTVCLSCPALARQASEQPLPDIASLWSALKPHLMQQYDDTELLKGYTYHRTSFVTQMGKGDVVAVTSKAEFEVYHFDSGPYNKLISRNDVKLSEQELKEQDEAFQKTRGKAPHRPPWRGGRRQRSPKEQEELLSDVYNAFDFTIAGREVREGRNTIRVDFKPRPNPKLKTAAGKFVFTAAKGTAWIDEEDHVLARIEFELMKDAKFGGGLIVNINNGSQIIREWRKVNQELWLPASSETRMKARVFMTKGFNTRTVEQFSDYRKFSVETKITPES